MTTSEPDELDALIEASLRGDQEAFGRIVVLKRELVFRTAFHQVGNADEARTIAQSVFVRLWRDLAKFDRARRFDTWLHQVTVNAAIDHRRRQARHARESGFDETFEPSGASAGRDDGADRAIEAREIQRILAELAEELTEKQRAAFLLREIEGLSTAEVAEVLGTTESTVRNHVFQARRILRDSLRARYPEYATGRTDDGARTP